MFLLIHTLRTLRGSKHVLYYVCCLCQISLCLVGAYAGIDKKGVFLLSFLPLPFYLLPPLPRAPPLSQKRIWCTIELSESH